ncbi:MAG: hypothetical protein ACR2JW_08120 [Thermomicrobiales bacterium]
MANGDGGATDTRVKRRGILAAAGAVVAGIVAKQTSQPVAAGQDFNFVAKDGSGTAFVVATSGYSTGVSATGSNYGVYSSVGGGYGVYAVTNGGSAPNFAGIYGGAGGVGNYGVRGAGAGTTTGVGGQSDGGVGVHGAIPATVGFAPPVANTAANTVAVKGVNQSTGAGGVGVAGSSVKGPGVVGGTPAAGPGVAGGYFYTTANDGSGVVGQCFNPGGGAAAFVGAANAPNYAAFFTGDVVVTGNFVVAKINGVSTGGGKSAAVQHPLTKDTRLVYCVESPDSWFEDFGEGQIVAGKAEVKVDPNFMALIHADSYHVFLTEHGGHNGLHTTQKGLNGFTVEASPLLAKAAGTSVGQVQGMFSWRVVGKRSDTKLERLAKFTMPTIRLPDKPLFDLTPPAFPKKG